MEQLKRFGKPHGRLRDIADPKSEKTLSQNLILSVAGLPNTWIFKKETVEAYPNAYT